MVSSEMVECPRCSFPEGVQFRAKYPDEAARRCALCGGTDVGPRMVAPDLAAAYVLMGPGQAQDEWVTDLAIARRQS